eukprot:jgi/Tetstr1/457646/TSEL_044213.t1
MASPSWYILSRRHRRTARRAPPSNPAVAYGAFRRVHHTTKTHTAFFAAAKAKAPWSELMRGSIEALYGTDDWAAKPYLSAINTFLRHTGRDDAPATGPAIIDMKRARQIRQLIKTNEELRRAPLPCDVITDILDELATLFTTTND